jgi:hypothetical protein
MAKSTVHYHGRYVIRAFKSGGRVRAQAYLGRERIAYAEGTSTEDVLRELHSSLNGRDAQQQNARKNGVPTAQEFENAFVRLNHSIGHNHWLMLTALLSAPNRTLTTTEIATAAGYTRFSSVNLQLGRIARLIAEDLNYTPPTKSDGTKIWTTTFATGPDVNAGKDDGHWRWTLRAEVADALRELNMG